MPCDKFAWSEFGHPKDGREAMRLRDEECTSSEPFRLIGHFWNKIKIAGKTCCVRATMLTY